MSIRTRLRYLAAALLLVVGVPAVALAQAATLTGKVTAENGTPLYGASVTLEGMNTQVGTTQAGIYTITVPAARVNGQTVTLRVRAIGYTPQTKSVTARWLADRRLRPQGRYQPPEPGRRHGRVGRNGAEKAPVHRCSGVRGRHAGSRRQCAQ